MKIGGGLSYVTGPMGAGKSYYGVRKIVESLTSGQYVITNIELRPDAIEKIARKVTRGKSQTRLIERMERQYLFTEELEEAMTYRLPGTGEARGRFVWDEGHNDLNNRDWRENAGRADILKWGTQLRKLGFAGFLLSQHADNTDVALRRICNYHVRLQNQREQTRVLGMRITPWPLFLACWYPSHTPIRMSKGGAINPVKVERYFLGWHRHLYDTFGLFHGVANSEEDGVIVLPELGGKSSKPVKPIKKAPPEGEAFPVLRIARVSPSGGSRTPSPLPGTPTSESAT
jgi:hypothetical protein